MEKLPKKRKKRKDISQVERSAGSKKQKLQDFTEIEFKVLLKNEATVNYGEHVSDNKY